MQLLKVFVIGMGAVIVIGTGVLIWGWTHHWTKGVSIPVSQAPAASAVAGSQPESSPFSVAIPLPEGMRLEQMAVAGGRALLRFSGPQGERILVIDPRTGRVTGSITVAPTGK